MIRLKSRSPSPKGAVVRLIGMLLDRRAGLRLDLGMTVVEEALGIAAAVGAPFLLKSAVDALSQGRSVDLSLTLDVVAFVFTWSVASPITALKLVHTSRILERLSRQITLDGLRTQLPCLAMAKTGSASQIAGALERLPYSLQNLLESVVWRGVSLSLQTILGVAALSSIMPWRYAAVLSTTLIIYFLISNAAAGAFGRRTHRANAAASATADRIGDVLRNAQRVVFNGAVTPELEAIDRHTKERGMAERAMAWLLIVMALLQYASIGLGLTALLLMGSADVASHRLTIGDFVLLQSYLFRLSLPLSSFAITVRQAGVSIANIQDCLAFADVEPSARSTVPVTPIGLAPAAITLRKVSYRYPNGVLTLQNVSCEVAAGSLIAIVGANGSGKSTLGQIMAGLIDPTSGTVRIGETDLRSIGATERHRLILYIPQFVSLFSRTLRENGLYPPAAMHRESELAALLATWRFNAGGQAVDLNAQAGEAGQRISGGQAQKLELARLHLLGAPAIVLDESTSALDGGSERRILESLRTTLPSTMVLITHSLSAAAYADRVFFIDAGEIAAASDHDDLLATCEKYRTFWDTDLQPG